MCLHSFGDHLNPCDYYKNMLSRTLLTAALIALAVGSTNYSFYVFTVEWKPTMCKTNNCVSGYLSTAFNIHGLWPSTTSGSGPQNCNGAAFSLSSSVTSLLETVWLSDSGTPQSFWQHEWQKHGTCVEPPTTPDAFFTEVVGLYNRVGVQSLLAKAGVTPSNSNTYSLNKLYGAFTNKVNAACAKYDGESYLENIELCFDLNLNQIDCQEQDSECDDGEFIFPVSD